ncbi:MAG: 2-oxo acid dehydrogenase subunit E2 [Lentisphaerae bacterium]|nr:2-oxo acid dehydrogenase subunit E2 [Lentisphaerota bacterium]
MATPIIMPRQGQSVESCILVEWLVDVGGAVDVGTAVASIETDKAVFEVESPASGTLVARFFEAGDDIPVLMNIAAVGAPGEDTSALKPDAAGGTVPAEAAAPVAIEAVAPVAATTSPAAVASEKPIGISPRARKAAAARGVNAEILAGSGPGGRVIERDVQAAAAGQPRLSAAARDVATASGLTVPSQGSGLGGMVLAADLGRAAAAPTTAVPAAPSGEPTVVPLAGIRKLIASKMRASLATTAQLTLNMSFDATVILAYRAKIKEQGESMGLPNITINDIVAYATVQVLRVSPQINACFHGDKTLQYPYVNLGIATDTPRGLMVPVIHGADQLSLSELSEVAKPLLKNCQTGNIMPDFLKGGTFTITNMGMLGVESFTPVLNVPEVAILGVGGLLLKPVMKNGEVKHVQSINLSLTIDHQVVDGAPGARFLKMLCTSLENFELTLAQ